MKIAVVGDTHRNMELLSKVAEWCCERQKTAALYHLGDDYCDMATLGERDMDVVQVPGIYDEGYRNGTLAAKAHESVLGLQILLVHSLEKDLAPDDRTACDVILYGHTHKAEMRLEDGHFYMNPGHLKADKDKNMAATFGILDIQDRHVSATVYDMAFKPVQRLEMTRSENGLYKAT